MRRESSITSSKYYFPNGCIKQADLMPKTLGEIKKLSTYPENFEKAVSFIKITQQYTADVVESIEKLINASLSKHSKENDLERLAHVAQK
ncbi:unnamed protein product, partial [Litomosoides sigmodontis]